MVLSPFLPSCFTSYRGPPSGRLPLWISAVHQLCYDLHRIWIFSRRAYAYSVDPGLLDEYSAKSRAQGIFRKYRFGSRPLARIFLFWLYLSVRREVLLVPTTVANVVFSVRGAYVWQLFWNKTRHIPGSSNRRTDCGRSTRFIDNFRTAIVSWKKGRP